MRYFWEGGEVIVFFYYGKWNMCINLLSWGSNGMGIIIYVYFNIFRYSCKIFGFFKGVVLKYKDYWELYKNMNY